MGFLQTDQPDGERFEIITFNAGRIGVIVMPGGGAAADVKVARHYFVDGTNGSNVTGNGSLSKPLATIQAAITAIEATTLTNAVIKIAPGDYTAAHVVAASATLNNLTFAGWNAVDTALMADQPTIGGNVVIAPGVIANFCDCQVSAAVAPTNSATDSLVCSFAGCRVTGPVTAGHLDLLATRTRFYQTLTGNIDANVSFDGYTWAAIVAADVQILPIDYTREFFDTGADVAVDTLTASGVPVLTGVHVTTTHLRARAGEFAICTLTNPDTSADFFATFLYTTDDSVHWNLFNISRSPGNFSESMKSVVFHSDMAQFNPA